MRFSYQSLLAALALIATGVASTSAQTTLDVTRDSLVIDGPYTLQGDIQFRNQQPRYSAGVRRFGMQFRNGQFNEMPNNIGISGVRDSPILTVSGANTVVRYSGTFNSAQGQSIPSLGVLNGGKLIFADVAQVNLVLSGSYFTRQFWILGDGTGTLEFEEGFIADRTQQGTVPFGLGSIRLSNVNLITNHSQNVPKGYRPNPAMINSHLVFENQGGTVWTTKTNPQEYVGGLWINVPVTVNTETNLELNGVAARWSDYTNWGGIIFQSRNASLTKLGQADLIVSGDQGYMDSSRVIAREGRLVFRTNPLQPTFISQYNAANPGTRTIGNFLTLTAATGGTIAQETRALRCMTLVTEPGSTITLSLQDSLQSDTMKLNGGVLQVADFAGFTTSPIGTYQLLTAGVISGRFSAVNLPALPSAAYEYDTSALYTTGTVEVRLSTSLGRNLATVSSRAMPNPTTGNTILQLPSNWLNERLSLNLMSHAGQATSAPYSLVGGGIKLELSDLPIGVYQAIITNANGQVATARILKQ